MNITVMDLINDRIKSFITIQERLDAKQAALDDAIKEYNNDLMQHRRVPALSPDDFHELRQSAEQVEKMKVELEEDKKAGDKAIAWAKDYFRLVPDMTMRYILQETGGLGKKNVRRTFEIHYDSGTDSVISKEVE